jgi:hypothetical protein
VSALVKTGENWVLDKYNIVFYNIVKHIHQTNSERRVAMRIKIDGIEYIARNIWTYGEYLPLVEMGYAKYRVAADKQSAGMAAQAYFADLAHRDPSEFIFMVGEKTIINWAQGCRGVAFGIEAYSMTEWLEKSVAIPEVAFGFNMQEYKVEEVDEEVVKALGFRPTVAYKTY